MDIGSFFRLAFACGYALAPYALLIAAVLPAFTRGQSPSRVAGVALLAALPGFALAAGGLGHWSLGAYRAVHQWSTAVLAVIVAVAWLAYHRRGRLGPVVARRHAALAALVALALLARLLPLAGGGESLGGDDARFHNILAEKILVEDGLTPTWDPVAPIRVMYPRATHAMIAFASSVSGRPVHMALNAWLAIVGALTVAAIYLLARRLFPGATPALFAAAVYAFIPLLGGLGYHAWAGLPSALGMLILTLLLTILLDRDADDETPDSAARASRTTTALAAAATIPAILLVHHYTLIVTALTLAAGALFTADAALRRRIVRTGLLGAALAAPLFATGYLAFAEGVGHTSAFVFRERPLTIWSCAMELSPALIVLVVVALATTRDQGRNAAQTLALAWLTALLLAFVFLEYIYRAGSLLVTGGEDCFTAFTPSRMITDMAYPMSLLCGWLPLGSLWAQRRKQCLAAFALVATVSVASAAYRQSRVGIDPDAVAVGHWLRESTPANGMLVAQWPHLPYLAWRECSHPPLPASEERRHPDLVARAERGIADWLDWSRDAKRPLYVLVYATQDSSPLTEVFRSGKLTICVPPGQALR